MTQPPKRKRNKKATIRRILSVTDKMIRKKGYAKVSTKAVADKAGVNISLIYKYFPNGKLDLIFGILSESYYRHVPVAKDLQFNFQNLNLRDFLKSLIIAHRDSAPLVMGLVEAYLSNREFFKNKPEFFTGDRQLYAIIGKILTDLGYSANNLDYVSRMLHHVIDSLIHRQVFYDNLLGTDEELIDFLVDLIKKYINV